MSDEQTHDDDVDVVEPAKPVASLLDSLRARRQQAADERSLDLLVPGYSGRVALRCGPISGHTQSALIERMGASKAPDRDFNLNADYLINACRDVVVRDDYEDAWQSLSSLNGDSGEAVRIDEQLVELLALEPARRPDGRASAREVLRSLFALAPSAEVAITIAGGEYVQWAGATNERLDESFAGES